MMRRAPPSDRGLNSPATLIASLREARRAAERHSRVAQPFKAGVVRGSSPPRRSATVDHNFTMRWATPLRPGTKLPGYPHHLAPRGLNDERPGTKLPGYPHRLAPRGPNDERATPSHRGMNSPATRTASLCEARHAAERHSRVAQPFKAGIARFFPPVA